MGSQYVGFLALADTGRHPGMTGTAARRRSGTAQLQPGGQVDTVRTLDADEAPEGATPVWIRLGQSFRPTQASLLVRNLLPATKPTPLSTRNNAVTPRAD